MIADMAVFDTATSSWYIRTVAGATIVSGFPWGFAGVIPVSGDYDGDGIFDPAVFDPLTGDWYIRSLVAVPDTIAGGIPWGFVGLIPVPGDFDGDVKCDLALYDRATGNWYIRTIAPGPAIAFGLNWGGPEFLPVYPLGAPLAAPLLVGF